MSDQQLPPIVAEKRSALHCSIRPRHLAMLFSIAAIGAAAGSFVSQLDFGSTPSQEEPQNELVMFPGTRISASNAIGTITVEAETITHRIYRWEGFARTAELWPRVNRWNGSFGYYFPGPGLHWKDADGIRRAVAEEGRQHFDTEEEAVAWLNQKNSDMNSYKGTTGRSYIVYTADGLVVNWSKTLERYQLNVEVWQIVVDGKKPADLPGNNDSAITVEYKAQDVPIGYPRQ